MPIITKDNVKYLQFGYGDIFVGDAKDKKLEKYMERYSFNLNLEKSARIGKIQRVKP
jgi:hypothetical protein